MRAAAMVFVAALAIAAACKKDPTPPNEGSAAVEPPLPKLNDLTRPQPTAGSAPFAIAVTAPPAKTGVASTITVAVTPGAGYQLNPAYPYTKLTVSPPAGLTAAHAEQSGTDATHNDKHTLSFAVELTAATAGTHKLTGELKFAVCTADESACLPQTRPVEVAVVAN